MNNATKMSTALILWAIGLTVFAGFDLFTHNNYVVWVDMQDYDGAIPLKELDVVTLRCRPPQPSNSSTANSSTSPDDTTTWTKNGAPLVRGKPWTRAEGDALTLFYVTAADEGVYICRDRATDFARFFALNVEGEAKASYREVVDSRDGRVSVLRPPVDAVELIAAESLSVDWRSAYNWRKLALLVRGEGTLPEFNTSSRDALRRFGHRASISDGGVLSIRRFTRRDEDVYRVFVTVDYVDYSVKRTAAVDLRPGKHQKNALEEEADRHLDEGQRQRRMERIVTFVRNTNAFIFFVCGSLAISLGLALLKRHLAQRVTVLRVDHDDDKMLLP
ncbi:hypothetical protein KHV-MN_00155 [Cyprinid herpesvirus 3]|nr:hypothetical protein KHV-MN_00155 [Cyprinid herpesvirus 3]